MATDAELLELARTALQRRLEGDAYDEYSEADRRFRGLSTDKIMDLIERLERRVSGGARFIKTIPG